MARKKLRSPLSAKANRRRNTKSGRKRMKAASFALPGKKKYRIDDRAHAANALGRVGQHGTPAEKKKVRAAVGRKFPSLRKKGR